MNYKIKQLKDIRNCDYAFEPYDWCKDQLNLDDYEVVYSGVADGTNEYTVLDDLFEKFNINHPSDFTGHSLSVSDIVELDGKNYYCDSVGWVELK